MIPLRCLTHRLRLWLTLVGRVTPAGVGRFSPRLAWQVACMVEPYSVTKGAA